MTTTTAFIPSQRYSRAVSGIATVDVGETDTLAIPCGGRAVVRIGVPTITAGTLTFNVVPYPGATARLLKAADGTTVTVASSTGGFVVDIPQLAGCFSFTIICGAAQLSARQFEVQCVGDAPALALTSNPVLSIAQYATATFAKPDVTDTGDGGAWTTANTGLTLFTVTGTVKARVYGVGGAVQMTSTANNGTLAVGVAGATGAFLPASTANGSTNFIANCAWVDATPAVTAELLPNTGNFLLCTGDILLAIVTNNMTAGSMTLYCDWIPVTADGNVVAA